MGNALRRQDSAETLIATVSTCGPSFKNAAGTEISLAILPQLFRVEGVLHCNNNYLNMAPHVVLIIYFYPSIYYI